MKNNFLEVALAKEACLCCGKEVDGPIIMNTHLTEHNAKKVKELHQKVIGISKEPCSECKELISKGLLIIIIDENKSDLDRIPEGFYRTGQLIVIKSDSDLAEHLKEINPFAKKKGYVFIDVKAAEKLKLISTETNT